MTITITTSSPFVLTEPNARTEAAGHGHQMVVVPKPDPAIASGVAIPSHT